MPNQLIEIFPVIPAALVRLPELASNLFFSWHRPTRALFEDLEPELWQQVGGNLRLMLRCISAAESESPLMVTRTFTHMRLRRAMEQRNSNSVRWRETGNENSTGGLGTPMLTRKWVYRNSSCNAPGSPSSSGQS